MTWSVFLWGGQEGDAAALLAPGLGCGEGGNRPRLFMCGQPSGTPTLWAAPSVPRLVLPRGQLNSCAFLSSQLLLPVPQSVTSCPRWLSGCLWVALWLPGCR